MMNKNKNGDQSKHQDREHLPGYPKYPAEEDIYKQDKEEEFIEDESLKKASGNGEGPGDDLDVPGAELDDSNEAIGEEDEENNYYSMDDQENEGND